MQGLGNDFVVFDARTRAVPHDADAGAAHRRPAFRHRLRQVVLIAPGNDRGRRRHALLQCRWRRSGSLRQCHALRRAAADGRTRPGPGAARQQGGLAGLQRCRQGPGDGGYGRARTGLARDSAGRGRGHQPIRHSRWTDARITASAVSMGNPHCILFVARRRTAPVAELGPAASKPIPCFPPASMSNSPRCIDRGHIRMRVWERGVGITLACGTGACATAVAAFRRGLADRKVEVNWTAASCNLNGAKSDDHVLMTGPGVTSFHGRSSIWTRYEPLTSSLSAAASTPMKARRSRRAPARRSCRTPWWSTPAP